MFSARCQAGMATDGDADRLGAVAEDGSFVDSHKCFSVILEWILKRKQWPGEIVRAFNTTRMLDRIAAKYGRKLHECGIGFKYICDLMLERDILIGGEESGGIGIRRHLPERDGILNSLLLANIMAEEDKPLGQLVRDLQKEYGEHHYGRVDLHLSNEVKDDAMRRAQAKARSDGQLRRAEGGNARRSEVFPRRANLRQRRRGVGADSRLGYGTAAARLLRSSLAGFGVANPTRRQKLLFRAVAAPNRPIPGTQVRSMLSS